MTDAPTDTAAGETRAGNWTVLGIAGILSLCCLFGAPVAAGTVGSTAPGGALTALGGGLVRLLVSAITVGSIGLVVQLRTGWFR